WVEVGVGAAEGVLAAGVTGVRALPLPAGPRFVLLDLDLVALRAPPLRHQVGVRERAKHELARRVQHRGRDDLLLAGLDDVFSLGHRPGLLAHRSSSPPESCPAASRRGAGSSRPRTSCTPPPTRKPP